MNTHLGHYLHYNDAVLGYDVDKLNMNNVEEYETLNRNKKDLPDVVLVRKTYPRMRAKNKQRYWKMDKLEMEDENVKKKTKAQLNKEAGD
jgi:nonsense-mediated mRNA decay protein 3